MRDAVDEWGGIGERGGDRRERGEGSVSMRDAVDEWDRREGGG